MTMMCMLIGCVDGRGELSCFAPALRFPAVQQPCGSPVAALRCCSPAQGQPQAWQHLALKDPIPGTCQEQLGVSMFL